MTTMFEAKFRHYVHLVENYLEGLPFDDRLICQSMKYSLTGGGKRIRPVLSLASAELFGLDPQTILPAAAAIELIHTYSLIHDDLPAMDDDDYRRGRLANHKMFGEAHAILAGDGLLTYAFELLTVPLQVPLARQFQAIREIAEAAGYNGMVGGQALDIEAEGQHLTLEEIETIHRLKTGALLKASVRLGAILAGATDEDLQRLSKYAQAIGLAFQIKDDILDVEGDSEVLGKPAGSDAKHGKSTYPALLGLEGAKLRLQDQVAEAISALQPYGRRAEFLVELARFIANRQK